jgi:hypothetical protein
MYTLRLVLAGISYEQAVLSKLIPEPEKSYVFEGISEKIHFIGAVEQCDCTGKIFRIIEGNPHAFKGAMKSLKNPMTISVIPM